MHTLSTDQFWARFNARYDANKHLVSGVTSLMCWGHLLLAAALLRKRHIMSATCRLSWLAPCVWCVCVSWCVEGA